MFFFVQLKNNKKSKLKTLNNFILENNFKTLKLRSSLFKKSLNNQNLVLSSFSSSNI